MSERKKPTRAEKDAKAKKNALRRSARAKVVAIERELTSGDLDTRKERVKVVLSMPPLLKRGTSASVTTSGDEHSLGNLP